MKQLVRRLPLLLALGTLTAGPALAQRPQMSAPQMPAPQTSAPATPQNLSPPPAPARPQPIVVQAGTGVLLPLPQPASTVMSADPGVARVQPASPTSLFLMGVAQGHTTVIAANEAGSAIVQYDVTVNGVAGGVPTPMMGPGAGPSALEITPETAEKVQAAIHRLMPGGLSIGATAAGTRLVLTGAVANPAVAEQAEAIARGYTGERTVIVDQFAVLSSIQVNVRVRIAEIDRTITRQLGFNWQALGNGGSWKFGTLTGAGAVANATATAVLGALGAAGGQTTVSGLPVSVISPLQPLGLAPFQSAPSSPYQVGAGFTSGNGKWDVNGIIDALAADQLVTILAEPNLTAQSGEPASFLAGGEFPIPIAGTTTNGAATITVDFKQYGVSLEVVPTVLSPTRLNLRVRPEVSQLSNTGAVSVPVGGGTLTIPALTVRRAETTVELGSGQSFAIAGLLQKTSTDETSALPGIGELPVIGALFKSNNFQRGESELVIIVTPYLVKPAANPASLQLPTDGFKPATDLDRILLGRQIAQPGGAPLDAGFILK
ncbi:MAG TPA: type II and III secretion system protein family protein [Acetobacteraceae bacterium]|jgi:pilus assembly protein CpaC|nr:type II and III secretion system protein family protein [Acetobacteraceae bacterium]